MSHIDEVLLTFTDLLKKWNDQHCYELSVHELILTQFDHSRIHPSQSAWFFFIRAEESQTNLCY